MSIGRMQDGLFDAKTCDVTTDGKSWRCQQIPARTISNKKMQCFQPLLSNIQCNRIACALAMLETFPRNGFNSNRCKDCRLVKAIPCHGPVTID